MLKTLLRIRMAALLAAIGVFEALRQQQFPHLKTEGKMADWNR